jgi:hypothetical protein
MSAVTKTWASVGWAVRAVIRAEGPSDTQVAVPSSTTSSKRVPVERVKRVLFPSASVANEVTLGAAGVSPDWEASGVYPGKMSPDKLGDPMRLMKSKVCDTLMESGDETIQVFTQSLAAEMKPPDDPKTFRAVIGAAWSGLK